MFRACFGVFRTCFGHVSGMFRPCFGHVSNMFRACVGHVLDMFRRCWVHFSHIGGACFGPVSDMFRACFVFRACFGHISDMFWKVSDKFRCELGVTEGLFLHQCSEYHFTFFVKRNFGAKNIAAQFFRAIFSVLRVSPGGFLIAS